MVTMTRIEFTAVATAVTPTLLLASRVAGTARRPGGIGANLRAARGTSRNSGTASQNPYDFARAVSDRCL
jgi:hypothetical protein